MKVAILGNGITSLTLAKALVNNQIRVDLFSNPKLKNKNKNRTLGISSENIKFFNENICNINRYLWNINKIEIYSENLKKEELLKFENNKNNLFSIVKNFNLYNYLKLELKKNKFFNYKNTIQKIKNLKNNYNLVINCDHNNLITKKFFYKKEKKNYNSFAHTGIINHKKFLNNTVAAQIFTKDGPLAFLPVSPTQTSIVYSSKGNKNINFKELIKKYNFRYEKIQINEHSSFELKSSILRSYYNENILAFGDLLHRIHPFAGQGFNMSLRDIKKLIELVKFRLDLGLELNSSICVDFEKNVRHKNYLFAAGIDLLYEFFNFESKTKNNVLSKSVQIVGNNKFMKNFFTKYANNGII